MKKIAILGAGTVGGSCAQILLRDAAVLEKNAGEALELAYVVDLREIEHRLGKIGLWFLLGGLAITPLRRWTGISALRQRRAIGLLAFLYIVLHLLAWLTLDMGLRLSQSLQDLIRRPYLFLGIASFALMLPLAVTSGQWAIRRMGRHWRQLHRLIYPAVLLAVLHYLWQMKVVTSEGWIWLTAAIVLLALRLIPPVNRPTRRDSPHAQGDSR